MSWTRFESFAPSGRHVQWPTMIGFLVAGLLIGALASLIKLGKQHLSILATCS